ncbi:hypothetical protein L6452_08523 [Arctium lappa]|uniref:Uncharacterized protein n=1 Tax=Arctium lappa TaxID=4217 RepID=A0ACB9DHT7_ARCLA|nr:hypothetical protein L6452_08523 [Arctium lappa]
MFPPQAIVGRVHVLFACVSENNSKSHCKDILLKVLLVIYYISSRPSILTLYFKWLLPTLHHLLYRLEDGPMMYFSALEAKTLERIL